MLLNHDVLVSPSEKTAIHAEPVWRERANFIIGVDLATHGMPGAFEQLWARTDGRDVFELCCIPFFTYGLALGDRVHWDEATDRVDVVEPSGHRCVRVAFTDKTTAATHHEALHRDLSEAGCLVEFSSFGYGAIDVDTESRGAVVVATLKSYVAAETLVWEWADRQA
jgi:hypothetical protein